MRKPPTGEPCAGKPPARFGGRGGREPFPTPMHRIRGSHHHYRYPNRPGTVTVAAHSGTIKRKTLTSIIKQAGMTVEEFLALL